MPLHDYFCGVCGQVLLDVYRSIAVGAQADPPLHCGRPAAWIPGLGMVDAFEPGGEFEVYDGQNRKVTIESFAQMHKLERESEQQARNGEGQPLRFRMLHQHRSNKEVNTFGPTPEERPTAESLRRFRPTEVDPDSVTLGPGVTEQTTGGLQD